MTGQTMKNFFLLGVLIAGLAFSPAAGAAEADDARQALLKLTVEAMAELKPLTAGQLHELVRQKDQRYLLVSLQSPEEYRLGHVPGSINLPIDLADLPAVLEKLPRDKNIVLISNNGQEACKITVVLRQLGYQATFAMLGLNAYNRLYAGSGAYLGHADGPLSAEAAVFPEAKSSSAKTPEAKAGRDLVLAATKAYVDQRRPFDIGAYDLQSLEDPFIISMQLPEDYAKGHIPGAVNIPGPAFMAGDERLLRLPKDRKIVVTCYIGHYSSMGAILLNQMGYEAYSLTWGISGWNFSTVDEQAKKGLIQGFGFEIEK